MGIGGGFWDVLRPVARSEKLGSLRGKKLAIDLSYWIVQQQMAVKGCARNPHIRLTFFRVLNLVARIGALPIFVVDGTAPPMKQRARMERFSRFLGFHLSLPSEESSKSQTIHLRNHIFNNIIKECVILLELLGMPVLRAKMEAEELCAKLDQENIVDACVTPDSDAFLHGARRVIKRLQADIREPLVEAYLAEDIRSSLGLGRKHLLALALLVGCDYDVQGVPGVGCRNAIRLIRSFPEEEILDELRAWAAGRPPSASIIGQNDTDDSEMEEIQNNMQETLHAASNLVKRSTHVSKDASGNIVLAKHQHCSYCGHPGNKRSHMKSGCQACGLSASKDSIYSCVKKQQGFVCNCSTCTKVQRRKERNKGRCWWQKIFNKISSTSGFPNERIIEAFSRCDNSSLADDVTLETMLKWRTPHLEGLEKFLADKLYWGSVYVRRKTLPLLSLICLSNMKDSIYPGFCDYESLLFGEYFPHSIERTIIRHAQKLYVLRWESLNGSSSSKDRLGLNFSQKNEASKEDYSEKNVQDHDDECFQHEQQVTDGALCLTTFEEMDLVNAACPELVKMFDEEVLLKKAHKKNARKKREQESPNTSKQLSITSFFRASVSKASTIKDLGTTCFGDQASEIRDTTLLESSVPVTEQACVEKKGQASFSPPATLPERNWFICDVEVEKSDSTAPVASPYKYWSRDNYPLQIQKQSRSMVLGSDKKEISRASPFTVQSMTVGLLKTNAASESRDNWVPSAFDKQLKTRKNLLKAFQQAAKLP